MIVKTPVKEPKLSKTSVNYSKGMGKTKCKNCAHFVGRDVCRIVAGYVDPNYWCQKFTSKGK